MSETEGTIPGNDGSLNEQVYTLVGFWFGSLIYGIYVVLFIAAIQVSLRNKRNRLVFSWVLFLSMISMFIMITIWTFISLYRGIQAFALGAAGPMPVVYYHNPAQWENFSFPLIAALLTWHGDLLVIYRCFVIWGHNFWVILVPVLLFLASFGTHFPILPSLTDSDAPTLHPGINTVLLAWFQHPTLIPQNSAFTLLDLVYPINLLQNVLTTGLIAFRIYTSHRRSRAAGLMHTSGVGGLSMLMIVRIVVESALIFTAAAVAVDGAAVDEESGAGGVACDDDSEYRRQGRSFSMILFLSMISMFFMITVYTGISLHRGIQAYALNVMPPKPVRYYHDQAQWDNYAFVVIVVLLTWHADLLVKMYRCFVIWESRYSVIMLPGLLFIASFGVNTITLAWFNNRSLLSEGTGRLVLKLIYPINLAQNILTTGLIAYRIYSQHKHSQAIGLFRTGAGISLLTIVRILIESALIFTVQQAVLMVLLLAESPGQVVLHATTVPSIGIVFVLMALRTHFGQSSSEIGQSGQSAKYLSRIRPAQRPGTTSVECQVITMRAIHDDEDTLGGLRIDRKRSLAEEDSSS
ncbi:hypothetical protein FA13DRAFT_1795879 [Coprinellus micaceus]|uniref:Uncharacterized protein n=1 Tax=Coprinellus micaceus TaxID=71717 RepID=A0A4Y7SWM4_COPMI|nr:hypothetical protein FA13DRAFT_1795879 [Coprinellus micaceus]